MADRHKQPWIPINLDDNADKTARIRVLEVEQAHTKVSLDKLDQKLDKFASGTYQQLSQISQDFKGFKNEIMSKELSAMEKKFNQDLEEQKQTAEISGKLKFLWTGAGMIIAGAIALLVAIFKTRFGG